MHLFGHLAACFVAEGVDTWFALLGDANMNWMTALAGSGVRMIYVRHKHCAVAAASAFARKSGQLGVATVTRSPGLTQVLTALPAALRAGLPLVIFAGEAPLGTAWFDQARYRAPHHVPCMAEAILATPFSRRRGLAAHGSGRARAPNPRSGRQGRYPRSRARRQRIRETGIRPGSRLTTGGRVSPP